jgi:hypothetical protein
MGRTYLGGRVEASRRTVRLAVGDAVAVLVFAAIGQARHGGGVTATLVTAGEFGLGWVVVATLLGAYGPRALASPGRAAGLGVLAWIGGSVLGAVIRTVVEPYATLNPVFVLVTMAVGVVILGGWRFSAAWLLAD